MDLSMPNMGGMEATRRMKGHCPKAVVLVLTAHEDEGLMLEALQMGAAGYMLKVDSSRTLPRVRPGPPPARSSGAITAMSALQR